MLQMTLDHSAQTIRRSASMERQRRASAAVLVVRAHLCLSPFLSDGELESAAARISAAWAAADEAVSSLEPPTTGKWTMNLAATQAGGQARPRRGIDLSPYTGQWVALSGDRVVTHGPELRDVVDRARQAGVSVPSVVHVDPPEPGVVYIGI